MSSISKRICTAAFLFSVGSLGVHEMRAEALQQEAQIRAAQHEFCPKFWNHWEELKDNPEVKRYCPQA